VQDGGRYAPELLQFGQADFDGGLFRGLVAGVAQDAHQFLADCVEHVMGVGLLRAAARGGEAGRVGEFADQLVEGDVRVLDQRLHGVDGLQGLVDVDRVVDLEDGFADVVAAAGGAADHLFVEDARTDAAHEDEVGDGGNVDAGGQQVDGDGDVGVALVLVALDQF